MQSNLYAEDVIQEAFSNLPEIYKVMVLSVSEET